jgi:hypothetical protein
MDDDWAGQTPPPFRGEVSVRSVSPAAWFVLPSVRWEEFLCVWKLWRSGRRYPLPRPALVLGNPGSKR